MPTTWCCTSNSTPNSQLRWWGSSLPKKFVKKATARHLVKAPHAPQWGTSPCSHCLHVARRGSIRSPEVSRPWLRNFRQKT